ncbi:hypothetical protein [Micromonospora fulviviridis]|uniref:Uncharacterized protein n=1 Tax=Micromonospora fulviviridis TaxID=47860 RepID=A0ABV2VWJ9_9ACTN
MSRAPAEAFAKTGVVPSTVGLGVVDVTASTLRRYVGGDDPARRPRPDDGRTWRKGFNAGDAKTVDGHQQFKVGVHLPPLDQTSKSVWLRVEAKDANGGTVTRTINHAYFLK